MRNTCALTMVDYCELWDAMQCTFDKRDIDVSEEPLYQIAWCHISGCTNVPANLVPTSSVSDSPGSVLNLYQTKPAGSTLLHSIFISTSLHVSGNSVPIIRRTYCIYATPVFFTVYGWLSGLPVGMRLVTSQPADQTATHTE